MNILGIGTIFSRGYGVAALEAALESGWQAPEEIAPAHAAGSNRAVYQVDFAAVADKSLLKKLRRADKLSKMSVLAAAAALADSGMENIAAQRVGIILCTAFGPHVTTFDFLDGILDYGEANVSPTAFSNSVHNAAASYIATSLEIKGPTLTVSRFRFSFPAALQLAKGWLEQGRCDYLLVGAVDQYGDVLGHVSGQLLNAAPEGRIRPFVLNPAGQVPGEGAAFFLLGREKTPGTYCSLGSVRTGDDPQRDEKVDLNIIAADGMLTDESLLLSSLEPQIPVSAYAPIYGSLMTGGAFSLATGAIMLKKQLLYGAPEQTNPHRLPLVTATVPASLGTIRCLDCNCRGELAVTYLHAV